MVSEPIQYILNEVKQNPGISKENLALELDILSSSMGIGRASEGEIEKLINEVL
ncbi:MAG: hypothetical protein ABH811_01820 [archaeon]